jgi:hypothetical protein
VGEVRKESRSLLATLTTLANLTILAGLATLTILAKTTLTAHGTHSPLWHSLSAPVDVGLDFGDPIVESSQEMYVFGRVGSTRPKGRWWV